MLIVSLLGPPGWGKSTLAEAIVIAYEQIYGSGLADTISIDDFGLSIPEMKSVGQNAVFAPETIRLKELLYVIARLKNGEVVPCPRFIHGAPHKRLRLASASNILIVEGIFAFWDSGYGVDGGAFHDLQANIGLRIYVDTDYTQSLLDLATTDIARKKTLSEILKRYHEREKQISKYVLPFQHKTDLKLITEQGSNYRHIREILVVQ